MAPKNQHFAWGDWGGWKDKHLLCRVALSIPLLKAFVSVGWKPVYEKLLLFFYYLLFSHNKDYTSITLYKDVARGPQKTTRLVRGGPLVTIILSNRTSWTRIELIDNWMLLNKLKLNKDKTDLPVKSSLHCARPPLSHIHVCDERVLPSPKVGNTGVLFDESLSMISQVTAMCKSEFYHLRKIRLIRKHLTCSSLTSGSSSCYIKAWLL